MVTLLSFTVKLAGTDRGGISKVWGLVAGNGGTILGRPVKGSTGTSCRIFFQVMLYGVLVAFEQVVSNWAVAGEAFVRRRHLVLCLADSVDSILLHFRSSIF